MKLEKGQVFSIKTSKGYGFLQYLETDSSGVEFVRVLEHIKESTDITQEEINEEQRWCCGFPLNTALNKKLITYVGLFQLPRKYKIEYWTRDIHNVRGNALGWHIVHRETLERKFKKKLRKNHLKLSPHGIFNDTLIRERLESNWKLSKWKTNE
jgi:hypothetical protein